MRPRPAAARCDEWPWERGGQGGCPSPRVYTFRAVAAVAWPSWRLTKGHPTIKLLAWPRVAAEVSALLGQDSIRRD